MPLGESAITVGDPDDAIVDNLEVRKSIEAAHGPLDPIDRKGEAGVGPAQVFALRGGAQGRVGFISAMSKPFCETCNRLRLTAVGVLRSCLFDGGEVNVLSALRPRPDLEAIRKRFEECVILKPTTHSGQGNRAMSQIGG
jgi:molybdenum cofactor biosynthesis enzyme MoaA